MSRSGILPSRSHYGLISKPSGGGSRRCSVSLSYSGRSSSGLNAVKNAKKIGYISREDATKADLRPFWEEATDETRIYTGSEPNHPEYLTNEEAVNLIGDTPVFRVVLSPEEKGVDLSGLAVRFMEESFMPALGTYDVNWVAANHYNTEHPHVHILVSRIGNTEERPLLKFPHSYLADGKMMKDARDIVTSMMGARTSDEERKLSMARTSRFAYTDTDRRIESRVKREGGLDVLTMEAMSHEAIKRRTEMRRRLSWLSANTGAVWFDKDKDAWMLKPTWKDRLRIEENAEKLGIERKEKASAIVDGRETVPYSGTIRKAHTVDDNPDKGIFSIVDKEGRVHIITDSIAPCLDPKTAEGKDVDVGFVKNADGSYQKKPRIMIRGALIQGKEKSR